MNLCHPCTRKQNITNLRPVDNLGLLPIEHLADLARNKCLACLTVGLSAQSSDEMDF
jgi:hypothetical protein